MSDLVSSAIDARRREEDPLTRTLVVSIAVHLAAIAALVFVPGLADFGAAPPEPVMTISLGPQGENTGGLTPIATRAIQRSAPTPDLPRPQPVRPPAAKPPEMAEPAKTRLRPQPPVTRAPREATARTPTEGAREQAGQGKVDTKAPPSMETGLSTSGVGGTGGPVNLGNFCDPQWLAQLVGSIQRNWNSRQAQPATSVIRFVVQRSGELTDVTVRQSSGQQFLDILAARAVQLTRQVPPLPACYPYPTFAVNLSFEYIR
jgi:TonB family protein